MMFDKLKDGSVSNAFPRDDVPLHRGDHPSVGYTGHLVAQLLACLCLNMRVISLCICV